MLRKLLRNVANVAEAGVAKLVDAQGLGPCFPWESGGSSPFTRTSYEVTRMV